MIGFKEKGIDLVQKYAMFLAMIVLLILFGFTTEGIMFAPANITNIITQNAYVLVLAIGMLLVIITGNIDLSVGSIVGFIGAVAAVLIIQMKMPVMIAIVICLLIGALIGGFNGFFVSKLKMPPFIVTLASMLIFRGLTLVLLNGQTVSPFPDTFQFISSGFILQDFVIAGLNGFALILIVITLIGFGYYLMKCKSAKSTTEFSLESLLIFIPLILLLFSLAQYNGIPMVFIILAFLAVVYNFFLAKTTLGREIYAIGGNIKAAVLSGIKTKRTTFLVFVNMGVLAAVSGIMIASRLNAATPAGGNGFELDAIAACFIGGASASGGKGKILGAIIGGLIMGILNNGMSIMGVGVDWQQAIKGLVLLAAVAFDVYSKGKKQ